MDKGIYCLILSCEKNCTIQIGALGERKFQEGWYIYVGSALGSGGLSRVSRHIRFFREHYRKPKWHIDYLMASDDITLKEVLCAKTTDRLECVLAQTIGGEEVENFGCSDCCCNSHLFYRKNIPTDEVACTFKKIGLMPIYHPIL